MTKGASFWRKAGLNYLQYLNISTRTVRAGLKVFRDYISHFHCHDCFSNSVAQINRSPCVLLLSPARLFPLTEPDLMAWRVSSLFSSCNIFFHQDFIFNTRFSTLSFSRCALICPQDINSCDEVLWGPLWFRLFVNVTDNFKAFHSFFMFSSFSTASATHASR